MTVQYWQRSRKPGAKQPPNTRCCTRGTKWGNPFKVSGQMMAQEAVRAYRVWLSNPFVAANFDVSELMEYDYLSCYCAPGAPCHVQDVLITAVNALIKKESAHV